MCVLFLFSMILFVVIHYFLLIPHLPCFTEYTDDEAQIQKHSSVIVRRIPIGGVKPSGKTYIVYVYFTKCLLFYTSLEDMCSEFTKRIVKPRHHLMVVVSLVFFSAEIVQTQLWWDLLDPYVKQTQKLTHTSHFSSSPRPSAFNHLPKNILSNTIQLCVPSVHCVLHLCWELNLYMWFDVFKGYLEVLPIKQFVVSLYNPCCLFWKEPIKV